jgi:hypothetical protein
MLSFEDSRWSGMEGGYRMLFDPRPLLKKLEAGERTDEVWCEIWDELHHQGDVGEASFAAVPHLVKICRDQGLLDWNLFGIVSIIELARNEGGNPDVPDWLKDGYFAAIRALAEIALSVFPSIHNPETVRAILSILAIEKGLRTHARFLVNYSDDELAEMESEILA